MSVITKLKLKIAEKATENLAVKAERGDFGPRVQKAYVATKGQKTNISAVLFIITAAVAQYGPAWAEDYARFSALLFLGLGWLGLVDKAKRNEPIFEPWLLQAIAQASAALTAAGGTMLAISQSGIVEILLPDQPCAADTLAFGSTVAMSLTAFLNRVTKASAADPK